MPLTEALDALRKLLGHRLDQTKPVLAAHGGSETHFPLTLPDAVAFPETTAEVAALVAICAQHRLPIIGWGAGTSLEAQALAVRGGLCVDFSRMSRLLEVKAEDRVARVQPGILREALNVELRASGLFFPVDPGANASLGGMASTRASGTTAVRYGTMRDAVAGLEVVLADGRVIRTGGAAAKSASGYDLTALFVGAEGTLGLITELTLRLQPIPDTISAATCAFPDIAAAVAATIETIQSGVPVARIELLDRATVAAVNAASGLDLPDLPHLLLEFHGSATGVAEQTTIFGAIAGDHGARDFEWATKPEDRTRLWTARHKAYWSILASRPGARAYVTDVCVPISRLAEAIAETQADIAQSPIPAPILGHVGDGNFHAILLIDADNSAEVREAERLAGRMADRALRLGGTVTGEHGIGAGKLDHMLSEHGAAWDVMGAIKTALDPMGVMNPGKLVRQS